MRIGNRKAVFTALVLAAGVLLCLGLLVYHTRSVRLRTLVEQRTERREQLRGLQDKLASRAVLERKYQQLQDRLAVLEPALPTYAYVPTFLRQIERLAQETDNKVAGVKPLPLIARTPTPAAPAEGAFGDAGTPDEAGPPAPQAPKEMYDRVPIEFNLTGHYWRTVDFLERLSQFPKLLAVDDVSLTPVGQAQTLEPPELRIKINLLALIQKGDEKWTSDAKKSSS